MEVGENTLEEIRALPPSRPSRRTRWNAPASRARRTACSSTGILLPRRAAADRLPEATLASATLRFADSQGVRGQRAWLRHLRPTRLTDEMGGAPGVPPWPRRSARGAWGWFSTWCRPHRESPSLGIRGGRDVLQNGPVSPYAPYFDIAWQGARPGLRTACCCPFSAPIMAQYWNRGSWVSCTRPGAWP